jgi:Lrp/AsnC family transcriptional regulator, leucine-responsive regulatory protein
MELDAKDRKLLHALDVDAREPNSEIAKRIGLSKQVVGFRIRRLEKERIVSSFRPVTDIAKLGFTIHKTFLKLRNIDQRKESELLEFLQGHPCVVWIASCDGTFDLAFGTLARDMVHLDATLKEIQRPFEQFISERQIATIIQGDYFSRDYLLGRQERESRTMSSFGAAPSPVHIDALHTAILQELGKDARQGAVEIAKRVPLGPDAIADRIRRMEQAGIIRGYTIVPNESRYPYLHYKILVGLRNLSQERERALGEYCMRHPHIVYTVKALGPWDFEIDVEAESVERFRSVLMGLKSAFSDIVRDYSTLHIYQVHKYNFCPPVISLERKE